MKEPLYFRRFVLTEVVVPAHEELVAAENGAAAEWPHMPIILVEGHLSNGMTALGESQRGATLEWTRGILHHLAGRNLWETLPAAHWASPEKPHGLPSLFPSGGWMALGPNEFVLIECLVFDALGKTLGVPMHFFWGGLRTSRVPVDFWCFRPEPDHARVLARRAVAEGFRGLKMKATWGDGILNTAEAMRKEVGRSFRITIDPMCAWRSFAESSFILAGLNRLEGYWQVEDPFPHDSIDCWKQARARFGLPLMWHARTSDIARVGMQMGVADGFNLPGSGSDFLFVARAAEFLGLSCWHGTSLELGVKQHFQLHATAAVTNAILGNDFQSEMVRKHTLVTPRMEIRDGVAIVPERPGLGIELDRPAVERHAVKQLSLDLE